MKNEVWNGEGVPPVGIKWEVYHGGFREWKLCKVLSHDLSRIIAEELDFKESQWGTSPFFYRDVPLSIKDFRPIKSPQDIEREKVASEIDEVICDSDQNLTVGQVLYDAGYERLGEEVDGYQGLNALYHKETGVYVGDNLGRWLVRNFKIYPRGE